MDMAKNLIIRILKITGVVLADIVAGAVLLVTIAWVIALAGVTLTCAAAGVFCVAGGSTILIDGADVALLPEMPYISKMLIGIAVLAVSSIFAVITEHSRLHVTQVLKKLINWNKIVLVDSSEDSLPVSLRPWVSPRKRRVMKAIIPKALLIIAISLVVCFITMIILSRSLQPWEVWQWFESAPPTPESTLAQSLPDAFRLRLDASPF